MVNLAGAAEDALSSDLEGLDMLGEELHDTVIINMRPEQGCYASSSIKYSVAGDYQAECVIYKHRWKYLQGWSYVDGWYDPDTGINRNGSLPEAQPCFDTPCLFDLDNDPTETQNVANENFELVLLIQDKITQAKASEL